MVPIPERVTERRYRDLAALNSSAFFPGLLRPPRITYGKKDTKPLSLTANQFRPDTYAIPSDDEQDRPASDVLLQAAARDEDRSEDSGLSDAEPLVTSVPKRLGSVSASRSASPNRISDHAGVGSRHLSKTTAQLVRPAEATKAKRSRQLRRVTTKAASKTNSKGKLTPPARRLPVNELLLVASPLDYTRVEPMSSHHGIQTQDPINDQASSPRKRSISPISSDDGEALRRSAKAPLSVIRKRLQTPQWRHKSLKQRITLDNALFGDTAEPKGCDGFESTELAIPAHMKVQRRRPRKAPLLLGFEALELRSGPLPEVEFVPSSTKLKVEASRDHEEAPLSNDAEDGGASRPPDDGPAQHLRRRVSDPARESMIRAQLLSIRAPERATSESDESDIDPDEEIAPEEEDVTAGYEDGAAIGDEEQRHEQESVKPVEETNRGVTLDFRRTTTPGRGPTSSSVRRDALIEVNEAIVEVPESAHQQMEYTIERQCEPNQPGPNYAQRHRPRSILKNRTQVVPDSTTRPEETAANTRRNSTVDEAESRYFTNAAVFLRAPNPARHSIVPRRRSCYFEHAEVQVPDTEGFVPETSPEPPDYTNTSDLAVLRRSSEAVWTSSSLPTAAKDLNTLTRSVSREHGTLSQAVTRRPSLPFRSPAVVR